MAIAVQTQLRVAGPIAMPQDGKTATFPPVEPANRVKVGLGIIGLGGDMLRLTFILCSSLFLVMLLGGRDFGQLRPGLAVAKAEAEAAPVTAAAPAVETAALADTAVAPVAVETVAVAATSLPMPVVQAPVLAEPVLTSLTPQAPIAVEPENTVFTLSSFADPAPETAVTPEQAAEGEIWYVAGNSLNVRSGPSTEDAVVGKLSRGEAMLVVAREGDEWAQIRIEGDGIEGYVATRFLTASVPVIN